MPQAKNILYFTSGLTSLINVLALRTKKPREDTEVFLVANSSRSDSDFFELHKKLVERFGIDNIYFSDDFSIRALVRDFPPETFDEVYTLSHSMIPPETLDLFTRAKFFWIDEGLSSYVDYFSRAGRMAGAYFPIYNGKMDFFNAPDLKINQIDQEAILRVASEIAAAHPLDYPFAPNDKTVIFLGQYLFAPLGEKALLDMHIAVLEKLVSAGYKIFFKPHPRLATAFTHNLASRFTSSDLYISKSRMPIEVYNTEAVALVSFSSGALMSMSHLYGLPAFYVPCDSEYAHEKIGPLDNLYYRLIKEYIPAIDKMTAIENHPDLSPPACRSALWQIFTHETQQAPMLSRNNTLRAEVQKFFDAFLRSRLPDPSISLVRLKLEYFRCALLKIASSGWRKEHYNRKCAKIKRGLMAKRRFSR